MKNYQRPRLIQLLKTVALLLEGEPLSGAEIMAGIGAAPEGTRVLDASQKRAFERLKEDLADLGVRLEKHQGTESTIESRSDGRDGHATTLYAIPPRRYMLRDLHLSDSERTALHLLAKVLGKEEGFPLRPNLGQALQKLSAYSSRPHEEPIPPVDGPPLPTTPGHDPEILDRLMTAAASRFPVEFEYNSFHSKTTRPRKIEPYGFFSRERVWYVVGREIELDEVRVFRVGRIESRNGVKIVSRTSFEIPTSFRLRDYSTLPPWNFRSDEPSRTVTLAFDRDEFWRVRGFCEQQGEVIEDGGDEILWRVSARAFEPLIRWMLPFGVSARPVEPPEFVEAYRESVRRTLKNYEVVRA